MMNKTVLYEGWQMECCGTQFKIGDSVKWTVNNASNINDIEGVENIDFIEDHHDDTESSRDMWILTGKVESISLLYNRYKEENNILVPVARKLIKTNDTEQRESDIDNFRFSDFIVELSDAKTRVATKQDLEA